MMRETHTEKICILGTGSWGLTLAWLLARSQPREQALQVTLWGRNPEKVTEMKENRHIHFPMDMQIPENVYLTSDLTEAVQDADAVIFVVTSKATREVAEAIATTQALASNTILVNASKGLEYPSLKPMSVVLKEVFPQHNIGVLSGPTLAKEILSGLPTACTISSSSLEVAKHLQAMLNCDRQFRLYTNTDVLGVELAGASKNVFAIASGYMTAKGLGDNAKAALLTRGLAEMARFCLTQKAEDTTIYGLAGLGDLLATCSSPLSRNFQVGFRLGKGEGLSAILADMKVVAEGVEAAKAVHTIAQSLGLDMPIVEMVFHAVSGTPISEDMMIRSLMNRKLKAE
ncbi:MAG: NAD(P)-dependent glycerol-3-phosphate dehydrogenase [Vampirovibrio sp.]